MDIYISWYTLALAFVLDLIIGDPYFLPHPIRWMGHCITLMELWFRRLPISPRISGCFFAVLLIASSFIITYFVIKISYLIDPFLKDFIETIVIYYCISVRSLWNAADDVGKTLEKQGLDKAKKKLAMIVGRDVNNLSENGVIRACIETVAENFVDGAVSVLFFAAIGGAPLAIAYKMVNTLDSMIGYKNEKYIKFGMCAAKIDDFFNFIPARISIIIIAFVAELIFKRGKLTLQTACKEGKRHSSPNAGYPEAAFCGAFAIKLGGPNFYHGKLIEKPYIGINFKYPAFKHIKMSCELMFLSSLIFFIILDLILILKI